MRRLLASLPLLVVFGCWEPRETALFRPDGAQSSLTGLEPSVGAGGGGGTSSGSSSSVAGQGSPPGTGGTTVYPTAGSSGSAAQDGGATGAGGLATEGGEAGAGGGAHPPSPASCDHLEGAVGYEANGHCYRVNPDLLDFAAAREACAAVGAHLVTIDSEDENRFVSTLLPTEHWLGATDSQSNVTQGVGTYTWVNDEPWQYAAWQDGQPNAKETGCPTEQEGSACYEHCGFQTDMADWNDRSCWHTIASVCEWELGDEAK